MAPERGLYQSFLQSARRVHYSIESCAPGGRSLYHKLQIKITKPYVEFIPFSATGTHTVNFYADGKNYMSLVVPPQEVPPPSIQYTYGEDHEIRKSVNYSYRFADIDSLNMSLEYSSVENLGHSECGIKYSFQ